MNCVGVEFKIFSSRFPNVSATIFLSFHFVRYLITFYCVFKMPNEKEIFLEMVVETTAENFFGVIVLLMFYFKFFVCSLKKCHFIYIDTWYIALTFVSVSEGKSSFIVFYISSSSRSSVFHLFSFTTMSSHILLQFIYKYTTTAHVIVQLMNTHNATTPQLLLLLLRLNFSLIAQ